MSCCQLAPINDAEIDAINKMSPCEGSVAAFGVGVRLALFLMPIHLIVALAANRIGEQARGFLSFQSFSKEVFKPIVISPIVEEVIFRGIAFPFIHSATLHALGDDRTDKEQFAFGFSLVVTSLTFGVLHDDLAQMSQATLGGAAYAYLTYRLDGDISGAIGAHLTHNLIVVFAGKLIAQKG